MAIFGPVIDQQQELRGRYALAQKEEKRLRLTIQSMEIFEEEDQRLVETLAHQQPLDRF